MGRTKTKIIDDSLPEEEVKKSSDKPSTNQAKKGTTDTLLESLKEELGIVEERPEPSAAKTMEGKEEKEAKPKKTLKPGKVKYRSKKYQEATKDLDKTKRYSLNEALDLVQKTSYTDFKGTVEVHINTNIKNIRGLVSLPFVTGKKLTILAFGPSTGSRQVKELEDMGVIVGDEVTLEEIEKGKINFDVLVTTPQWMSKLAKVAKVLGPRGLMPSPKNGTITEDLKKAVTELQGGKIEYKTEKDQLVIHLGIGKVNQPVDEISQNIKVLFNAIGKTKVKKLTLSPTMGPGIKVELGSI